MPMRRSRRELLARIPKSSEPSYLKVPVYLADETTARFETRSATTPEQALCAAVLSQALIDLRTNVQIEYVRDWVAARYPAAITFVTCCDALGLYPAAVREQLDRIRPQSGVDRRFAGRGLRHGIRRGAPLTTC